MMTSLWHHQDIEKSYNIRQLQLYWFKKFHLYQGSHVQNVTFAFVNWTNFKDFMAILVQFYGLFYTKNGISQTFFLQS